MLMIVLLSFVLSVVLALVCHSWVLGACVFFGSLGWLAFDNFFGKGGD